MSQLGFTLNQTSGYTTLGNCSYSYPNTFSYQYYHQTPTMLGEFDLHLDSCGNLRVIHKGKVIGEFKPDVQRN